MTLTDIPSLRLYFQNLSHRTASDIPSLIAYMGAVQAQDAEMSKWAIGVRLPQTTRQTVEEALVSGSLVRTHVLRPTWHVVAGKDVRWMQALTGKYIKTAAAAYARDLGLDAALYARANDIIIKALEGGKNLTREELMQALAQKGIETNASRAVHFMMNAETDAIVCNGVPRGKEQTYALVDEKVPPQPVPSREEALSMLAERYFTSHAPATVQDFHWWSGLPMGEARAGLQSIKHLLEHHELEGKTYFLPKHWRDVERKSIERKPIEQNAADTVFFLPAFDEYCVSYKDRSAVFAPAWHKQAITSNGIFKPIIVVNGRVVGIWKRTERSKATTIEPTFFDAEEFNPQVAQNLARLNAAAEEFARFQGMAVVIAPLV